MKRIGLFGVRIFLVVLVLMLSFSAAQGKVIENGTIQMEQTIQATTDENVYDLTLTVDSQAPLAMAEDTATVLVVDLSSTMQLADAKNAVSAFINHCKTASSASHQIAVVGYRKEADTLQTWQEAKLYDDSLSFLQATGDDGVNLHGGLLLAKDLLDAMTGISNRSVVLISAKAPNFSMENGAVKGGVDFHFHHDGAKTAAKALSVPLYTVYCGKNDDDLTVYAGQYAEFLKYERLYLEGEYYTAFSAMLARTDCSYCTAAALVLQNRGVSTYHDSKTPAFLSDISTKYIASSTSTLANDLKTLANQLVPPVETWNVTATLADHIHLTSGTDRTLSWNVASITPSTTPDSWYRYAKTYRVWLDTLALTASGEYAVTSQAYLERGADKKDDFDAASKIQGLTSNLSCQVLNQQGDPLDDAVFSLEHASDCTCIGQTSWTKTNLRPAADGTVTLENVPSGHAYVLREVQPPSDYLPLGDQNVKVTNGVNNLPAKRIYTKSTARVTVTAAFGGSQRPVQIDLELKPTDGSPSTTALLSAENSWTHLFTDIKPGDYQLIQSPSVVDQNTLNPTSTKTGGTEGASCQLMLAAGDEKAVAIENSYEQKTGKIDVQMTFASEYKPESVALTLNGPAEHQATLTATNSWKHSFENLKPGTYRLTELATIDENHKLVGVWVNGVFHMPSGNSAATDPITVQPGQTIAIALENEYQLYDAETLIYHVRQKTLQGGNTPFTGVARFEMEAKLSKTKGLTVAFANRALQQAADGSYPFVLEGDAGRMTITGLPADLKDLTLSIRETGVPDERWTMDEVPEMSIENGQPVYTFTHVYTENLGTITVNAAFAGLPQAQEKPQKLVLTLSNGKDSDTLELTPANAYTATSKLLHFGTYQITVSGTDVAHYDCALSPTAVVLDADQVAVSLNAAYTLVQPGTMSFTIEALTSGTGFFPQDFEFEMTLATRSSSRYLVTADGVKVDPVAGVYPIRLSTAKPKVQITISGHPAEMDHLRIMLRQKNAGANGAWFFDDQTYLITSQDANKLFSFTNRYTAPVLPPPPQTGDNSAIALWAVLMLLSALGCAYTLKRRN